MRAPASAAVLWPLALGLLACAGCSFDAAVSALVTCDGEGTGSCPTGFTCQAAVHRCVRVGAERTPPVLRATSLEPRTAGPGARLRLVLESDEALLEPPRPQLRFEGLPPRPFELTGRTELTYDYALAVRADDPSGVASVAAEATDLSGNVAQLAEPPSLTLDTRPPYVVSASLQLSAGAGAVEVPTRLGPTVTGTLRLTFDEALADAGLAAEPALVTATVARREERGVVFELRALPDAGTQPLTLAVEVADVLGNAATLPLTQLGALQVDTQAPGLAGAALLERVPFGDARSASPRLLLHGATEPGLLVRALSDDGLELGRQRADADGGFAVPVALPDRARVAFELVDQGGNATSSRSQGSRLVLTPSQEAGHHAQRYGAMGRQTWRDDALDVEAGALRAADGVTVTATGAPSWRNAANATTVIAWNTTAYDARRGVAVALGGTFFLGDPARSPVETFLEFDGKRWMTRPPPPGGRAGAALAFDMARGVLVAFGGAAVNETLEWDGALWRRSAPAVQPPQRWYPTLVTERDGVLLLGGAFISPGGSNTRVPDAWVRRGGAWQQLDAGRLPLDRVVAAYDRSARQTLIVAQRLDGGAAETWLWDGEAFRQLVDAGAPPWPARNPMSFDGELLYDDDAQAAYFVPFTGLQQAPWRFVDGGWSALPFTVSTSSYSGTGTFLPVERRALRTGYATVALVDFADGGVEPVTPQQPNEIFHLFAQLPDGGVFGTGGWILSSTPNVYRWTAQEGWRVTANTPLGLREHGATLLAQADGGLWSLFGLGGSSWTTPLETVKQLSGAAWSVASDRAVTDAGPRHRMPFTAVGLLGDAPAALADVPAWRFDGSGWVPLPTSSSEARAGAWLVERPDEWWVVGGGPPDGGVAVSDEVVAFAKQAPYASRRVAPLSSAPGGSLLRRWLASAAAVPERDGFYAFGGAFQVAASPTNSLVWAGAADGGLLVTAVATSDAEADGEPEPRVNPFLWWDAREETLNLVGGSASAANDYRIAQHWALRSRDLRPGVVLRFSLRGLPLDVPVGLRATATASGVSGDGDVAGARLSLWRAGQWRVVATHAASGPAPLAYAVTAPLGSLAAPGGELVFLVEPLGVNQRGSARLTVDAFELIADVP